MIMDLTSLISKGGVFTIEGSSTTEIYEKVCNLIKFPESITSDSVFNALCAREKIMSTAVGNGIALPHASVPIIKEEDEQRVCVVYLKEPLDMNAPDEMKVHTMFVILTQNRQTHLQVLSRLVSLLRDTSFLSLLENQANGVDLIEKIKELY